MTLQWHTTDIGFWISSKQTYAKAFQKNEWYFIWKKKSSMKNRSLKEKEFQNLILVHIKLAIAKRINNSEN